MKRLTVVFMLALLAMLAASVPASADPPSTSGIVFREEVPLGGWYCDLELDRCIVYGGDWNQYCSDPNYQLDPSYMHLVSTPPLTFHLLTQGDLGASLWPAVAMWDCEYTLAHEPLATGTVKVTSTDNDLAVLGQTNTWATMLRGTLHDTNGDPVHVNAQSRVVFKIDPPTFLNVTSHFNLH